MDAAYSHRAGLARLFRIEQANLIKYVEKRPPLPDPRDVFLCHAWVDRGGAAKELHDLLESRGVSVWFSEKDVVRHELVQKIIRAYDRYHKHPDAVKAAPSRESGR